MRSAHGRGAWGVKVFSAFGERGVRSEQVVERLVKSVREYLTHGAPVGEYMSDQIPIPLALAGGGSFRIEQLSRHATTNMDVIRTFLGTTFDVIHDSPHTVLVSVR